MRFLASRRDGIFVEPGFYQNIRPRLGRIKLFMMQSINIGTLRVLADFSTTMKSRYHQ